jgi:octaprenyl-diphosphate synthase
MLTLAKKVKAGTINADEIAVLVEFTKNAGGIEYAERKMDYYHQLAQSYIDESVEDACLKQSLTAYLDYVINRTK